MPNIENLNKELKILSDWALRVKPWVESGLLDYRRMESEYSQVMERNAKVKAEILENERKLGDLVKSQDLIRAENEKKRQEAVAEIQTLYIKAQAKFKEVEKRIDDADRKVIKGMLKEMEAVAA